MAPWLHHVYLFHYWAAIAIVASANFALGLIYFRLMFRLGARNDKAFYPFGASRDMADYQLKSEKYIRISGYVMYLFWEFYFVYDLCWLLPILVASILPRPQNTHPPA
jgi:hypothetical protein